ncbi:acyltransferase family protein [Clostridium perfringens]|nr:acyltransferase family protein [Clostridium perfringens]
MLLLHLFCIKSYEGLYTPLIFIGEVPLVYYLALFGDCCVVIYCFCSGCGLMISYENNRQEYLRKNLIRIFKLYINFWIILFIFVVVLGFITGRSNEHPGILKTFLLTFTAISPGYNGAWWFLTTYIILVLISPFINNIIKKYNIYGVLIISFIFYFLAYIQRIKGIIMLENEMLNWAIRQLALFGTSQLPFVIGGVFAYRRIYSKIYNTAERIKYKNILGVSVIIFMIIAHGFVEGLFVAVFIGVVFICVFNIIDKPRWINKLLDYLSNHSTNMWLIHMFFYMIYFKNLVFALRYSFLIFPWLIILCLASSYIIKLIEKPINEVLDKYLNKNKINAMAK